MEYIPGAFAYFIGGFLVWASKTFIWKVAHHWSVIWVGNAEQASSQILSLASVVTLLILFGVGVFVWSLANHINYKNTEKGFIANLAGGLGIATAFGQELWLNQIATSLTTYTD